MKREITYKCELCGSVFINKLDCQAHEKRCTDRRYYVSSTKSRIKRYFNSIELKGFNVSVIYDTNGRCLITITDIKRIKR